MSTVKDKYLCIRATIALWLLLPAFLHAQNDVSGSYWSVTQSASVEITPLNVSIQNDSVTLHWKIQVSDIRVRPNCSHVLMPILADAHNSLSLPRVIISGRRRASYDMRERALDPFQRKPYSVSVYRKRRPVAPIYYSVSFPYATWMEHCSLELRQVSESTARSLLLSSEYLCNYFPLRGETAKRDAVKVIDTVRVADIDPSLVPVLAPENNTPPPPADSLRSTRIELFLAYPTGYSGVNALFSENAAELAKTDRLLLPLLNNPRIRIRRILITGYSSPDGIYQDNEQLAKKRAQEFVRYLCSAYPLPAGITMRTAWVAEDWQGLRQYLEQSDIPFGNRALHIIDHTGIFEGRERELMLLNNGNLYRTIKRTIFPKLRRIELVVEQEPNDCRNNL